MAGPGGSEPETDRPDEESTQRTPPPLAFFTIDHGRATTSAALVGRLGGRWRLLGASAMPAGGSIESLLALVAGRLARADVALAERLGIEPLDEPPDGPEPDLLVEPGPRRAAAEWPRLESSTHRPGRMVILAASDRQRDLLAGAAGRSGWEIQALSTGMADAIEMTRVALLPDVRALVVGSDDPPGGDERAALPELAALAVSCGRRRPELQVVFAGAMSGRIDPGTGSPTIRPAPAAALGEPIGDALRATLAGLLASPDDSRTGFLRSAASLAVVLGRTVEAIELGVTGGAHCSARSSSRGSGVESVETLSADAALVPAEVGDANLDEIAAWLPFALDRQRLRDRVREVRREPWVEADGDGALLRLAAGRAALRRLMDAVPDGWEVGTPDLVVLGGGPFTIGGAAGAVLAYSDMVRRPGTSQIALDHARLLGPIGTIEDEDERRRLLADLIDDLLLPLATLVMPAGLRRGRNLGRVVLHEGTTRTERRLTTGVIQRIPLAPGRSAVAEFDLRGTVDLGVHGRHFATDVAGGLAGLVVDLRDVPLTLADRPERRREQLLAWAAEMTHAG